MDKALVGFAMSSNSILQKIEAISNKTSESIARIEKLSNLSLSTMQGLLVAISENTKVLTDIKDILSKKSIDQDAKIKNGSTLKNLIGTAGLIAVVGFGVFTLSMAFKATDSVTPAQIGKGILVLASLIPALKIVTDLLKNNASVFGSFSLILKFTQGVIVIAGLVVAVANLMRIMPNVQGTKLLTFIAVSTALYIQGKIVIELIKAWEFSGFINKFLNSNNTDEIMKGMVIMTINTVFLATAMTMMPNVTPQHALSFVIATSALIPIAVALFSIRFAMPAIEALTKKGILKLGAAISLMSFVMVPIALSAKLIGKINISEQEIKNITQLLAVLAPITAMVGLFSALINLRKEAVTNKRLIGGMGESLLKKDNSRKRNLEMDRKNIINWALKVPLIIGAIALTAIAFKYALPAMASGINAMSSVDFGGLMKFILISGITVLIFGFVIGKVTTMIKGSSTETPGMFNVLGSSKSKPGKITQQDTIMAALIIPVIILSVVFAAVAFSLLGDVPKLGLDFLQFAIPAGIAILTFGLPFVFLTKTFKKSNIKLKDIGMGMLAMAAVSISIMITAWAFSAMDGVKFIAPPIEWSISAALSIVAFAIPIFILGKIAGTGAGAMGILFGAIGIIVVAASIWVVAQIFSTLPSNLSAAGKNLMEFLLSPVNSIVDVLRRFKDEIGIENLLPLAGGIVAVSGALLVLAAAATGSAVMGIVQGFANIGSSIAEFFSGKKTGPLDVLDRLAGKSKSILALANPLSQVADSFSKFAKFATINQVSLINRLVKSIIEPISPESAQRLGITNMVDYLNKYAVSVDKIANSYGKIANHSKMMNVDAINASTNMFNALAYLANAGKDNALKELGDTLVKAVKELALMIADFEGTVQDASNQNNETTGTIGSTLSELKEAVSGIFGNNKTSNNTPLPVGLDSDEIVDAIRRLERSLVSNGIKINQTGI